jgi:selenocysteine-specific elongation factor
VIVATAGHVDHGKTSLVRALTGVDTDRLPEEKRRGMSIDLGFAYLPQPGGESIAFVDVPGHERFIRNMTAGVPGIDLALLVVAADDGPMPQTREHLAILEHLGAPRLLAVLSKIDRVAPERLAEADAELRALLPDAEIVKVSSVTGEGVDSLRGRLESLAREIPPRSSEQRFRLHVDRAFVIDGLGLVVTGTVASGSIAVGGDVQLLPAGRKARVRSLRANNGEAARALAGQRCALALQGVSRDEVERGHIVVDAGPVPVSKQLDIEAAWFGAPLTRPKAVGVHLGTAMLQARLSPHGRFARLAFPYDVSAWHGDRLLLRDPGTQRLIGAGAVVDSLPPARGAGRREKIAGLGAGAAFDALLADGMVDVDWFEKVFHAAPPEAPDLMTFAVRGVRHVMYRERWDALCGELERAVGHWHAAHPESIGPRPGEVGVPPVALVDFLVTAGRLRREGPSLCLPGHRPVASAQDEALWEKLVPLLEGEGGKPPRVHELASRLAMEPKALTDFLQRAARAGRVHRVAPNRFFLPHAVERLVDLAVSLDEETAHQGFGAAAFRDRCGLGRNLTIEVLEFLDSSGYTRRAGDLRRTRKLSMEEKRPRWGARTSNPERGV